MGDKMKVKVFVEQHEDDLSDAINEFIESKQPKILDIRFATAAFAGTAGGPRALQKLTRAHRRAYNDKV